MECISPLSERFCAKRGHRSDPSPQIFLATRLSGFESRPDPAFVTLLSQIPGERPGKCVQQDNMRELIEKIEGADGIILASPTNFSSVTALFKRFMERLVVYAYWPWGAPAPKFRKRRSEKKAILIASSAAPGILGRFSYTTLKQLRMTAKTIGAKPVGSVFIGLMSQEPQPKLPRRAELRVRVMVERLLR